MTERARLGGLLAFLILVVGLVAVPTVSAQGWRLEGLGGASLDSGQVASGQTVLIFWASWSPRGRDIVDRAVALERQFQGKARFFLVNFQEDEATARQFLGSRPSPPVLLDRDGALAKRHAVLNLPGMVVFKNGEAVYSGRLTQDAAAVLASHLD